MGVSASCVMEDTLRRLGPARPRSQNPVCHTTDHPSNFCLDIAYTRRAWPLQKGIPMFDYPRYRKAIVAVVGAAVTVLAAFNVPVADGLSDGVVAAIDTIAAVLVFVLPNDPS